MTDIFIVPGVRTPFVKAGGAFAGLSALQLSAPVAAEMARRAKPDLLLWGQVIPDPGVSNIARELVFEAGLDPGLPAASTVMACSTSFMAALAAAGFVGRGGVELALIGGVETMTHVPIALGQAAADRVAQVARRDPSAAGNLLAAATAADFQLPSRGWANRLSGRSQGEHTEDTAKRFGVDRHGQDALAFRSHQRAVAARAAGFFDSLLLEVAGVSSDGFPRPDTTMEKLAALPPAFDASGAGTLTAGNSSPVSDGAAAVWVASAAGVSRLGLRPEVRLVDWELAAMDFRGEEGILMAPARAIPRLLARHGLRFDDVGLWELHEAFAAQVLANLAAAADPDFRRERAGVDVDLGEFPWERLNPNGGSLALGHPFAATGARILSQAAKALAREPAGARAVVSLCADGGQGTVALLERVAG